MSGRSAPAFTAHADAEGRFWVGSGGPWEERFGYSRAVAVGGTCFVAGTTDAGPDGLARHPDARGQAEAIWDTIEAALGAAGFALADVVRTRMYLVDAADLPAVGEVHGRRFAASPPAATAVIVASLIDPSLKVEIEVDAVRR